MIAVRGGQAGQDDAPRLLAGTRIIGQSRQLLKQGQGLQLQRVQIEWVSLGRHRP